MGIHRIDPLTDPRWNELVNVHPDAGVFHTRSWLECLRSAYGYQPVVYTTTAPGKPLENGMVFCRIKSWVTGRRLVSLPFSDHCEPLLDKASTMDELAAGLRAEAREGRWNYVEWRPLSAAFGRDDGERQRWTGKDAYIHTLDITPPSPCLLQHCHQTAIRQTIKRAEREGVEVQSGRGERLLDEFYRLMLMTRRKHKLPPPPLAWFRTLVRVMDAQLRIYVARLGEKAIASILTLSFRGRHYYKYSCFDLEYRNIGGTPYLLWMAIQAAKEEGGREFDLGRSDADNEGLITFKDRWGASRRTLTYFRYPALKEVVHSDQGWRMDAAQTVFSRLPDRLLILAGNLLYRHIG